MIAVGTFFGCFLAHVITNCRTSVRAGCFTSYFDVSPHECSLGVIATHVGTGKMSLALMKKCVSMFLLGTAYFKQGLLFGKKVLTKQKETPCLIGYSFSLTDSLMAR